MYTFEKTTAPVWQTNSSSMTVTATFSSQTLYDRTESIIPFHQ